MAAGLPRRIIKVLRRGRDALHQCLGGAGGPEVAAGACRLPPRGGGCGACPGLPPPPPRWRMCSHYYLGVTVVPLGVPWGRARARRAGGRRARPPRGPQAAARGRGDGGLMALYFTAFLTACQLYGPQGATAGHPGTQSGPAQPLQAVW